MDRRKVTYSISLFWLKLGAEVRTEEQDSRALRITEYFWANMILFSKNNI